MVEGKRDGRLTEVPGADQYGIGAPERRIYIQSYHQAIKFLSDPAIKDYLNSGIDLSSRAIAYAENQVIKHFEKGSILKKMAKNILQMGNQIIKDRGWSVEPQPQNFAWQLYGDNSPTAHSLTYAVNNNRIIEESEGEVGRFYRGSRRAILAIFTDIPDLLADAQPDQTNNALMHNFFTDLATRLGFTREEGIEEWDDISLHEDSWVSDYITTLQHHTLPFIIRFRSNSDVGAEYLSSIDIQYHRRFSWRKR